jgi:hypothetical protein
MRLHKISDVTPGISENQLQYVLDMFEDRTGSFVDTVTLPYRLGMVQCALYGPEMNDEPIESDGSLVKIVDMPSRKSCQITVHAGPYRDEPCVLFKAYGGPMRPANPKDEKYKNIEKSQKFWSEHALSIDTLL